MAQLVARLHGMEEVWGSNPHSSTNDSGVVAKGATPFRFSGRETQDGAHVQRGGLAVRGQDDEFAVRRGGRSHQGGVGADLAGVGDAELLTQFLRGGGDLGRI